MCIVSVLCDIKEIWILVELNLDGIGSYDVVIGVGFFDYMLE